jgi:hypothetical protein
VAFPIGWADTAGHSNGVATRGNQAFLADGVGGLQVFDLTDSGHAQWRGCYSGASSAAAVTVVGDLAYVANGWDSLEIVDVSDPAAPSLLGSFKADALGVTLVGGYALIKDGWAKKVRVIDVSNPTNLVCTGECPTAEIVTGEKPRAIAVIGNYACVADGEWGLAVMRVPWPSADQPQIRTFRREGPELVVEWDRGGVLQSTPAITGPWTDGPSASPARLMPVGPSGFFRVAR